MKKKPGSNFNPGLALISLQTTGTKDVEVNVSVLLKALTTGVFSKTNENKGS